MILPGYLSAKVARLVWRRTQDVLALLCKRIGGRPGPLDVQQGFGCIEAPCEFNGWTGLLVLVLPLFPLKVGRASLDRAWLTPSLSVDWMARDAACDAPLRHEATPARSEVPAPSGLCLCPPGRVAQVAEALREGARPSHRHSETQAGPHSGRVRYSVRRCLFTYSEVECRLALRTGSSPRSGPMMLSRPLLRFLVSLWFHLPGVQGCGDFWGLPGSWLALHRRLPISPTPGHFIRAVCSFSALQGLVARI